jgi:hypothetical protein
MRTKKSKFLLILVMSIMLLWMASNSAIAALSESFTGTTFPPTGWTVYNFDGSDAWVRYTTYYNTSPACAQIYYDPHNNDWLITPQQSIVAYDKLTFYYRAQSTSYVETLFVRVSTSATVSDTSAYAVISTIITSSTTWAKAEMSLNAYAGQNIYIAFHYPCYDNYGFMIDDVNIITPPANDMATLSISNPTSGASLEGNSTVSVQATVKNSGTNTQNNVPVHLMITDGVSYTYNDTEYTGTLTMDQTELMTFAPDWTVPNSFAGYTIKVWTALSSDANAANDTVTISVSAYPEGYTVEGFEGTFPPEGWDRDAVITDWAQSSGNAHGGTYKAYARGQNAWLFTPRLSVGAGDKLKYWYRSESASYPTSFYVRLSTSADQTDTSSYTTILANHSNITSTTYQEGEIDLSPYAGLKGPIYVAFHRYYGYYDYYYLFLDDVSLPPIYVPANDMATISVDDVPGWVETGTDVTIKATVQNLGGATVAAGEPVKLRIDGPLGYVYLDQEATTVDLDPSETEQITFSPDWHAPDTLCGYFIKVWTELSGDGDASNDTSTQQVTVYRAGGLIESFTGTTFPPPGWTVYNFYTTVDDAWVRYTSYFNTAPACARCNYDYPNNDWLITPRLKVVDGDKLKFWWRAGSSSYQETLLVRVSTNADVSDTASYTYVDMVTGNSLIFTEKVVDLSAYAGQYIYIAFHYPAYNKLSVAIDDVTGPYFPTQIHVSVDSLYFESFPDMSFCDSLYIGNNGGGLLEYKITKAQGSSWLSVDPDTGTVPGGEKDTIAVCVNTSGLDGHYYDTLIIVSNSGEKQDGDTTLVPIHIWVRLIPDISVSPDSLAVGVEGDGTKDTSMFISNSGNGDLEYSIKTVELAKVGAIYRGEPATRPHIFAPKSKPSEAGLEPGQEEGKGWVDPYQGTPPLMGLGGPDAFGYRWIDSDEPGGPTFNWVEISGVGTQLSLSDDQNAGPFAIGFPFEFYGTVFDSFRICANGWISFTSTATAYTNAGIPTAAEPNNLLALFWDDLYPYASSGQGYIYYYYDGSKQIIEYDSVPRLGGTDCLYKMEAILYPNGQILYQYKYMGGASCTYLNSATIGIENATGTDGLEVIYNANYVHNNLAIRFSAAPSWLVFSPELGTVPLSETDTIDVTFDATGILSGDFYGAFLINSNDPDTPVDTVPAHMHVLVPDMTFTPASIETSGTEGQAPFDVTMDVGNAGAGRLTFSIVEGIPWLSVSPVADTVPSGDPASTITLTIDCTSLYAGNYQGQLKVYSNDPDFQPYATYNVSLHVGPDADIAVNPDSFYVGLYAGLTKDTTMTIANEGDGHLVWGLTIEELTSPKSRDTILTEGFEGAWPPAGWSSPDGWQQECVYYAHTGLCGAYLPWGYSLNEWLITPSLTLGTNSYLNFWWESSWTWSVDPYDNADLFVKISTNGGSSWTTLWTFGDSADVVNSGGPWPWGQFEWAEATLDLSAYTGSALIAFNIVADDNADIAIDDVVVGTFAAAWLTIDPMSGMAAPHSSKDVDVHFSTVGISEDKYASLWIASNDPDESPVLVPVHLAVLGPEYSIVPPETLVIDVTETTTTDSFLYVSDFGGHGPLNCKMSDPVAWMSELPDSFEVAIDETFIDTVRVDGTQLISGTYETYIAIKTNDFDEGNDTIVVVVRVGPPPAIRLVPPDSFHVQVLGGATKDTTLWVCNDGDGHLSFEIKCQETPPPLMFGPEAGFNTSGVQEIQKRNWIERPKSALSSSDPSTRLTGLPSGNLSLSAGVPGNPVSKGDTIYAQYPTDPSGSWSFATSDNGPGYKVYENFWGLTKPISGIEFWGVCMYYSGGWYPGNPDNLVFDISFYSDPPDDPTMPPTQLVCTYTDVVPTHVPYLLYSSYQSYFFSVPELNPLCNLEEGWVAIQSKSGGSGPGYDWFMWASATSGDGYSYQEGSGDYFYDDAFILIGGIAWLTTSPVADTTNPHDSTNVTVHFDATQLMGGEKYGNILVSSNAPDKAMDTVKVHMIIGGAQYSITPNSLDFNVDEGYVVRETLLVSNPGGSGPLVYKMTDPVSWLVANPDSAQILPDETLPVVISVFGDQLIAGEYSTKIAIKSNGANQPNDTIPVDVHVGPPPQIEITPPSLNVGIMPGCTQVENLKVSNLLGAGHLRFETAIGPAAPKADVLLVDDDHSNLYPTFTDVTSYFTAALTANGYTYDIFEVPAVDAGDGPDAATMAGYPVVIWSCGESWQLSQTLTPTDEANLATYLDGGGSLFLSAQDYFWDRYSSAGSFSPGQFPYDYLGVTSVSQDVWYIGYPSTGHCVGMTGSVAEGMAFDLWDPYTKSGSGDKGPDDGLFIDQLTHNGVDVFQMTSPTPTGIAACQYESPKGFKTVFTTVDFGGLIDGTSPSTMAELMGKIMDFLSGVSCPFTVNPEADTIDPHAFMDLPVTFDGTAFEACDSLTLHCELTFTTNDPVNPTITVPVTMWVARGDVMTPACLLNVQDVVFLINYVFITGPAPDPLCMGDADRDGDVDSDDALYLISYLFLGGPPPEMPLSAPKGNDNMGIKVIRPIR